MRTNSARSSELNENTSRSSARIAGVLMICAQVSMNFLFAHSGAPGAPGAPGAGVFPRARLKTCCASEDVRHVGILRSEMASSSLFLVQVQAACFALLQFCFNWGGHSQNGRVKTMKPHVKWMIWGSNPQILFGLLVLLSFETVMLFPTNSDAFFGSAAPGKACSRETRACLDC